MVINIIVLTHGFLCTLLVSFLRGVATGYKQTVIRGEGTTFGRVGDAPDLF